MLSVSRDGVALGLAPWSYFEVASVACVSVLANGKKRGTVYLGRVPETNQVTLPNQLTSLLKQTIHRCGDAVPEIVYVSDAGKIETAYRKNTPRKFFVNLARNVSVDVRPRSDRQTQALLATGMLDALMHKRFWGHGVMPKSSHPEIDDALRHAYYLP